MAGALGEVGGSVSSALDSLGHVVVPVSSRGGRIGISALSLDEAVMELEVGDADALLSAAGRGDRRTTDRTGLESTSVLARAAEKRGIPAVLLSTTRVLEGRTGICDDDAQAMCSTAYARANADNEIEWLQSAPSTGSVVRITNYFCEPMLADSPQSLLLPWSLVTEAVRTGGVILRSSASTSREFVSARDVAQAVMTVIQGPDPVRICTTSPGMTASLADLAGCTSDALSAAGLPRPSVTFGDESSPVSSCRPGWLHEHGWSSTLSLEEMTRAIASWLGRVDLD